MAEGFEPYHVPQQSRRDKLRIVAQNHPLDLQSLLPLYNPSLFSSSSSDFPPNSLVKQEAAHSNLMAFASSSGYNSYLDPPSSSLPNLNPNSVHDVNGNFFLYTPNLEAIEQSYNGVTETEVIIPFKPEPLSLSLSSQKYGSSVTGSGEYAVAAGPNGVSRSGVPVGPFTGYASVLKGSIYLKHTQQLLEEFCNVGGAIYSENIAMDASFFDPSIDCLNTDTGDGNESRRNKSRLISMLDEVYRRYKYYFQQMQAVVASFECVAGLGNAAPYANLTVKTLSKHFKSLKDAITDQLNFTTKLHGKEEATRFGNYDKALYTRRPAHNSGFIDHQPVWRPQRGLPERAVNVLKAWLFEHFLHPYPNDTDKLLLAKQTGLSRSQVSNWFINARVRLWKPMVEEIHMLETRQAQKGSYGEEQEANELSKFVSEIPSTSTHSKRSRSDLPDFPDEPLNSSYGGMLSHAPLGVSLSKAGGRSSGVSLTLGLHQNNNGMGVSEPPFPLNYAAQRLGLETSDGLVMGGFQGQN